jgi:hypothetical protein
MNKKSPTFCMGLVCVVLSAFVTFVTSKAEGPQAGANDASTTRKGTGISTTRTGYGRLLLDHFIGLALLGRLGRLFLSHSPVGPKITLTMHPAGR